MLLRSMCLALLALIPAAVFAPASAQSNQQQYIVVYVEFQPSLADQGEQKLRQLAHIARSSSGVIGFYANRQIGRENFFSLVEIWNDAASYQNFLNSQQAQAVLNAITPLLEAPLDVRPGNLVE
ncbi:MAG: antibiotic biosynthesis monooxygenase [Alphaproteobacteria bacterium]|nr:antibiotic biosynthesis monooxygenase [Alphaproteobacteria bacterium]